MNEKKINKMGYGKCREENNIKKVMNHSSTAMLWSLLWLVRDNTETPVFKSLVKYLLSIYYQTHGEN